MKPVSGALLVFLVAFSSPSSALSGLYVYRDIHPAGWSGSAATCVNSQGDVAGHGVTPSGERGFLWTAGTVTEILPTGADSARATWVNGRGVVAGTAYFDGIPHAFLFRGGEYLDPTPGWAFSEATSVSDEGVVTGTGERGAFVSKGGASAVLPGFNVVVAGNSSGQLVGSGDNAARVYLPSKDAYVCLNPPGSSDAATHGINESGLVVLTSRQSGYDKGYVYSGGFFISMTPPGWTASRALAINNLAVVAGHGDSPQGRRSFVRSRAEYEILAFPGWTATEAVSVNDSGQVAGSGETPSGDRHAFVATPSGAEPSGGSVSSDASSGSGGCAIAAGRGRGDTTVSSVLGAALLFAPAFLARRRSTRR